MIKIAFSGDIMLARNVGQKIKQTPDDKILSKSVHELLSGFDFVVGNLECPVSSDAVKLKEDSFRACPGSLSQVEAFHLLSLANNHIFDCGKQGALDTIEQLKQYNKIFCGLLEDENSPPYKTASIAGKDFAFFACAVKYCIKDNDSDRYPKIVSADDPVLIETVKSSSEQNDYTIVLIHGGNEMIPYPEPYFRNLCQSYIDAGADVVITHHPHVLGGVHLYKNKYIFYSLGDFIFDGESSLRRKGVILNLMFEEDSISYVLYPTQINQELNVDFAPDHIAAETINRWNNISSVLLKDLKYNHKYRYRYIQALLAFQIDRLSYLIQNKGIVYVLRFIAHKFQLAPFYFKKIFSKNI